MSNITPIQNVVVTCLNYSSVVVQGQQYVKEWETKVKESVIDYVLAEYNIDLDPKKTEV